MKKGEGRDASDCSVGIDSVEGICGEVRDIDGICEGRLLSQQNRKCQDAEPHKDAPNILPVRRALNMILGRMREKVSVNEFVNHFGPRSTDQTRCPRDG